MLDTAVEGSVDNGYTVYPPQIWIHTDTGPNGPHRKPPLRGGTLRMSWRYAPWSVEHAAGPILERSREPVKRPGGTVAVLQNSDYYIRPTTRHPIWGLSQRKERNSADVLCSRV